MLTASLVSMTSWLSVASVTRRAIRRLVLARMSALTTPAGCCVARMVLKIIQTGGVTSTGTWSNLGDKVSVATGASSGELDYVVTLKSGDTLGPGTYEATQRAAATSVVERRGGIRHRPSCGGSGRARLSASRAAVKAWCGGVP
jgi:hypothetical protein